MINSFDFKILSETWKRVSVDVEGFKIVITSTLKTRKSGRNSEGGGVALLYKSKFNDWISVEKESSHFLWFKISKEYTKLQETYMCVAPISHHTIQITSVLIYLTSLKTILKNSLLLAQFFLWEI